MEGQITQAFTAVLSKDTVARKEAESFLASLEGTPGFWPALCHIAMNPGSDLWLAQSAVVLLKNSCKLWRDEKRLKRKLPLAPVEDKNFLKTNIMSCLSLSVPAKIRSQFEEIAKGMAESLYPGQWDISVQLQTYLEGSSANEIYSALSMISQLSRVYEYSQSIKRKEIEPVILYCFPKMLGLLRNLVTSRDTSLLHVTLILTSFWNFSYIEMHPSLAQAEVLGPWLDCFCEILSVTYGAAEDLPTNEKQITELSESPLWTAKRLSVQIVVRLFQRTSNATYVSNDVKPIADFFLSQKSLPFLQAVLQTCAHSQHHFVSPQVLSSSLKYLSQAAKTSATSEVLKPLAFDLIVNVLIPLTCRTPKDEELWRDDAVEFVRREMAPEPLFSPVASALHLFSTLCHHDSELLVRMLQYLCTQLQSDESLLHKEAAMRCIGNLREVVQENATLVSEVETMLTRLVKPHLYSQVGFLRARACWTYGQFAYYPMTDSPSQVEVTQTMCRHLVDSDLPVKFQAAISLPKILRWAAAKDLITPELPRLLEIYLNLIEDIDSEDLIIGLEGIINRFSQELLPHVTDIVSRLTANFMRIVGVPRGNEKTASDSDMAAVSCLNTINKIVSVVQESDPSRLVPISHIVVPVLEHGLSVSGSEFFEEVLDLITCLLYFSPPGSLPHLLPLFRVLLTSGVASENSVAYAQESLSDLYSPLANVLSKYKPQVLEQSLLPLTVEAIGLLMNAEKDIICAETQLAGKLCVCLFENYPGMLGSYAAILVKHLTQLLAETKYMRMKELALEGLGAALWYDSQQLLPAMEPNSEQIFQYWIRTVPKFSNELAKRYTALGFLALLKTLTTLSRATFPLLKTTISLIKGLEEVNSDEEGKVVEVVGGDDAEPDLEYDEGFEIWKPDDEDLYDPVANGVNLRTEVKVCVEVLRGLQGFHEAARQNLGEEEVAFLRDVVVDHS